MFWYIPNSGKNPATLMLPSGLYSVSFLAIVVSSLVVFGGSLKPAFSSRSTL